jgi:hypothetical protein
MSGSNVKWQEFQTDQLFGQVGEQPGSQTSYERDVEIKRRTYVLESELLAAQIATVKEQSAAVAEMRRQSTFMLWSTIAAFATALITLIVALIQWHW